jgi:hypothetical protein
VTAQVPEQFIGGLVRGERTEHCGRGAFGEHSGQLQRPVQRGAGRTGKLARPRPVRVGGEDPDQRRRGRWRVGHRDRGVVPGQGGGQTGPAQAHPGRLDRHDGGRAHYQHLASAAVEAPVHPQRTLVHRLQPHASQGLRRSQRRRQERRKRAGGPVGRQVAAQHQVRHPVVVAEGGGERGGRFPLAADQAGRARARHPPGRLHAQRLRRANRQRVPQHLIGSGRGDAGRDHLGIPPLRQAQRVLQGGKL